MGCGRFAGRFSGRVFAVATALSLTTPNAFAQGVGGARTPEPTSVQASRAVVPHAVTVSGMSVVGSAWKADNTPIPHARLRLRNIVTGRIEAETEADDSGRFIFETIDAGSYLVELVNDSGKVLALSHPFTIGSGETIATFVRLGTKVPWFEGFFGSAALAVAAGAAAAGLTAVAPEQVRPVSGRQ